MSLTEIQSAVSELSDQERGNLAAWLLDSLPSHSEEDADDAGIEEAARRREELDSGKARPLTSSEFWSSLEGE
jgi:hypothetical protein